MPKGHPKAVGFQQEINQALIEGQFVNGKLEAKVTMEKPILPAFGDNAALYKVEIKAIPSEKTYKSPFEGLKNKFVEQLDVNFHKRETPAQPYFLVGEQQQSEFLKAIEKTAAQPNLKSEKKQELETHKENPSDRLRKAYEKAQETQKKSETAEEQSSQRPTSTLP